ncbi:MAG: ThiF family adenylyltransferase [Candidatus Moranbacteria bacterium]|nr:ThiF family adenylyltransferase [Candidatus Moranbacteria bacterium]
MINEEQYYQEAFSRNIGLLTVEQQKKMRQTTLAIVGLGGVGGIYAASFARLGFGGFRIADMDAFEVVNINRQFGATVETFGKPKTEVLAQVIKSINPFARVETLPEGINEGNVRSFVTGVDFVIDGLDFFNIEARRLLFREARAAGVFILTAGPVGFGSSMLVFDPQGMSFDDYFDIHDKQSRQLQLVHFGFGLTPSLLQRAYFSPEMVDWNAQRGPSLVTGTLACANLVTTEVLRILRGEKPQVAPASIHFDPYLRRCKKTWVPWGNKNPLQRIKLAIGLRQLRAAKVLL